MSERNEYLPPANVTMTDEEIVARIEELLKLREEAHFEAVFHAFSDEDSCRIAADWRNELDEALKAWREVLARPRGASGTPVRKSVKTVTDTGSARPVRWWDEAVRRARSAWGRATKAFRKRFRR